VPMEEDMKPRDPVSENMAFLNGDPTKAFIYQDHDAHISVHSALMQDPLMMAQIGQNPQAQKMQAEIMAHISEHLAFAYRSKVEQQLGVELPAPNEEIPKELEVQLSRLVAQAAQQVLAQSKAQAQQQQAQQMAQDPIVQMQQAELQIKKQDADTKAKKVEGDLLLKQAEIELKAQAQGSTVEDPVMIAERHRQEMEMQAQRHDMEMAQAQQAQQLEMQKQQQGMAQAQQMHAQQMAHGGQVHGQKLTHAQEQARIKAELMRSQPKPKAKED
jgi:hypothetical protein